MAHPEVELVGVWGRDPAKTQALADALGTRAYADADELIAAVDAVAVALPPDVQADVAARAAAAGRHLLLDKPLALSVDAADRVVAAVEASGVSSVIFFTRRYYPAVTEFLRQTVGREWDGAQVTMFASIFQPGSPYAASPWRRDKGGLWDVGPHALSLVLPVLGPVASVAAVAGPHSASHLLLQHVGGAVSSLALTLDAPPAATAHEFVFYGSAGRQSVPDADLSSVEAFGVAVSQLIANAGAGMTAHPCDVRFGREVGEVLSRAETAIAAATR